MNKYGECLEWINSSLAHEAVSKISQEKRAKFDLEVNDVRNKVKVLLAKEERDKRHKRKQVHFLINFLFILVIN